MVYTCIGNHDADWAGKTHEEVAEIAESAGSIVIVPIGSLEQHGRHMPTGTDSILCDAVAHLGAEQVDDLPLLITPPVWSGFSPYHMGIGGTVTLEIEHMLRMVQDIAKSVLDNGFDAILFLNGHGGNMPLLANLTQSIGPQFPDVEVLGLTYWALAKQFIDDIRDSDIGGIVHGGEFETALMLHLRPELVNEDKIEVQYYDDRPYDLATKDLMAPGSLSVYRPMEFHSETGVGGDPSVATAEKGERIYELLGDAMGELLTQIHEQARE